MIVVLERGEELIAALTAWCAEQGISNAVFQGIGAVERVQIGYYTVATKKYHFLKEDSVFEVASMQGNVALVDGKPFVHAHAVLSRTDDTYECIGAHLKEAYVAVTLEIFMIPLDSSVQRVHNDTIGLKLIEL